MQDLNPSSNSSRGSVDVRSNTSEYCKGNQSRISITLTAQAVWIYSQDELDYSKNIQFIPGLIFREPKCLLILDWPCQMIVSRLGR